MRRGLRGGGLGGERDARVERGERGERGAAPEGMRWHYGVV